MNRARIAIFVAEILAITVIRVIHLARKRKGRPQQLELDLGGGLIYKPPKRKSKNVKVARNPGTGGSPEA